MTLTKTKLLSLRLTSFGLALAYGVVHVRMEDPAGMFLAAAWLFATALWRDSPGELP